MSRLLKTSALPLAQNIAANATWDAGNRTYHLMGTGTPFTINGIFAYGTSTMSFENTTSAYIVNPIGAGNTGYYNLQTNPASGTPTYTFKSSSTSFLAGTKVLTADGEKNIEDLKIGDVIKSYDLQTNSVVLSTVSGLIQGTKEAYYVINGKVQTTGNHIFLLADQTQKAVQDLNVGDILSTYNGTEAITSISLVNEQVNVYDIDVENYHLFYAENYLVHNFGTTVTINNDFTLTGNGHATVETNIGNFAVQVQGDFSIGANQIYSNTAYSTGTSVYGNFTNAGTFTHNNGTVTLAGTSIGKTINPGASHFYNLTFNGVGGAWSPLTNKVYVDNDLTMTAGTFNNTLGSADVEVAGTVAGTAGVINFTNNTFTQRVAAAKNFGTTSGSTNWTFNNLNFENSSAGNLTVTTASTATGQIIVNGMLTIGNATDTNTTTLDNETNDRIIAANNVTITSKGSLTTSSTASFTVAGNWSNSGTFTCGTGTVTFDGTTARRKY